MSYDIMVFEPTAAPADNEAFQRWYAQATQWDDGTSHNDPRQCSPALQAWCAGMRRSFWALNGPYRSRLGPWLRPDRYGDYGCTPHMIYATFAWSWAEVAHETATKLALKHGLGLFDVSGSGQVLRPAF